MCVDSRAINKVTIKYHYHILRLEDLHDELYGATIFYKIDYRVAITKYKYRGRWVEDDL